MNGYDCPCPTCVNFRAKKAAEKVASISPIDREKFRTNVLHLLEKACNQTKEGENVYAVFAKLLVEFVADVSESKGIERGAAIVRGPDYVCPLERDVKLVGRELGNARLDQACLRSECRNPAGGWSGLCDDHYYALSMSDQKALARVFRSHDGELEAAAGDDRYTPPHADTPTGGES